MKESDNLVKKYLMEHLHVPDYQAEIDASFAQGSIGKAQEAATSEEFGRDDREALRILKYANTMELMNCLMMIKELSDEKQNINDYLDIFQFWFRDVLMFKATKEIDNLVFKQEINYIKGTGKASVPMRIWRRFWKHGEGKGTSACKCKF